MSKSDKSKSDKTKNIHRRKRSVVKGAFSRRNLLLGLGAGAALAPFLPVLSSTAQDPLRVRRFIALFTGNGTVHENWQPTGSENDFEFGSILEPLTPFKSQVSVLQGIDYPNGGFGNNHANGAHKYMSGSGLLESDEFAGGGDTSSGWGSHISLDQYVKERLGARTLELAVRNRGANPRNRLSYSGSDQPITPEQNPRNLFDRIFAGLDLGAAEREAIRRRDLSVIDLVKDQLAYLQPRIGSEDRLKLDVHLTSIRSIENGINELADQEAMACSAPGEPADPSNTDENAPQTSRLMIDMMVAAMSCNMAQIATFMWGGATSGQTFPHLSETGTDTHHTWSHKTGEAVADRALSAIGRWYAGEVAYLMEQLEDRPDPAGGSLLDNTLMMWGSEITTGNHRQTDMPLLLAGGAAGHFRMGRYIRYDGNTQNELLVSILNYLGVEEDSFGNLDEGRGALPRLI